MQATLEFVARPLHVHTLLLIFQNSVLALQYSYRQSSLEHFQRTNNFSRHLIIIQYSFKSSKVLKKFLNF